MLTEAESIELRDIGRGRYFRLIADVWAEGQNLATALIEIGFGRAYAGEKRGGWCTTSTERELQ